MKTLTALAQANDMSGIKVRLAQGADINEKNENNV